ncbi:MAG: hypothetical protein JWO85_3361 [Candidatus Eremiobacteraeota bacterium]|jgi:hypothetical protein|nr:hypothetical protein [Candidatus Eremiobacteraeota bacterium]
MKRTFAAVVAALVTTAAASAQSYPGDPGTGTERGVEQVNNSGQVGTVTLFRRDAATRVQVAMHGVGDGRLESVRIYRGPSCDDLQPRPTYFLADLKNGVSRSSVGVTQDRLLSGNYNVVVFSNNHAGAQTVACGHLY